MEQIRYTYIGAGAGFNHLSYIPVARNWASSSGKLAVYSSFTMYIYSGTPDTRLYTRNEGPPKGHCTKAYKPRDPSPTGYREGTRNMGATIITSKELVPHKESTTKVVKNRRPPTQVEINYMHRKMGR